MFTNGQGFFYEGDLQPGDRLATPEEVAEFNKPPVPQEVPIWAMRQALEEAGLFDPINSYVQSVKTTNRAVFNVWEYGNYAVRSSKFITDLAGTFGITDEQADALFFAAKAISEEAG